MPVIVRERKDSDLGPCAEVLSAVHAADRYPSRWPDDPVRWLSPSSLDQAWVATLNPGIVGHVGIGWPDEEPAACVLHETGRSANELMEIVRLFVHPNFRGAGFGQALLDAAIVHARRRSRSLFLAVNARRDRAHRFYERCGWRFAGEGPGDIVMPDGKQQVLRYYVLPASG